MEAASHSRQRARLPAALRLRFARRAPQLPFLAMCLFGAVAAWALLHAGRGTTFFFDDWDFVLGRQDWSTWSLLRPHNEHLSLVPVLVYKLALETVGIDQYGVLRGILVALDLTCGVLLFAYARRRVGPWPAAALAATVTVMAAAWWDLLWAFQIGFMASMAAGLGVLLAFDRRDRLGDALACVLLCVSVGSSSLGLPVLGVAMVEVLLSPGRRRRLWVVGVPAIAYIGWYLKYGKPSAKLSSVSEIPRWIVDASDDAAGAVIAFGADWGRLAVVGLVLLAIRVLARPGTVSPRLVALLLLPLAYWALTALGRAHLPGVSPSDGRYLYPGGLWLALAAVELGAHAPMRGRIAGAVAGLIALAALANLNALDPAGGELRGYADKTRGAVTAIEAFPRERVPFEARPEPGQIQLGAGQYLEAVERYGPGPVYTDGDLVAAPDAVRAAADTATLALVGTTQVSSAGEGTACRRVRSPAADRDLEQPLPDGGMLVRARSAPVDVSLRRYGDGFGPLGRGTITPGDGAVVTVPPDALSRGWTIGLRSSGPIELCRR